MANETKELAKYIVSDSQFVLRDPAVCHAAREALLDWIACTAAGAHDDRISAFDRLFLRVPVPGNAALIGKKSTAHPLWAALFNGAASHVLELDDTERTSYLHPGVAPIAAAFAAYALNPTITEETFLRAITVGYEVGIRVGRSVNPSHYQFWHTSGTAGAFAAAAACAVILGLGESQTIWALGNAGTEAAGLWQFNRDGALTKPYHIGMAAVHGLLAALSAQEGFTGPSRILEGEQGFLMAMSKEPKPEVLVKNLTSDPPAILGISRKRWASCRFTHSPIDGVIVARQESDGRKLQRMFVETSDTAIRVAGHHDPQTPQEAKFSIAYCCAVAWLTGDVGLTSFDVVRTRSGKEFQEVFSRIDIKENPLYSKMLPERMPACVTILWDNDKTSRYEVLSPLGDPEQPITGGDLYQKVNTLLSFAGYSEQNIQDTYECIMCFGDRRNNLNIKRLLQIL